MTTRIRSQTANPQEIIMNELHYTISYDSFCSFVEHFRGMNGVTYTVCIREMSGEVTLYFPCLSQDHRSMVNDYLRNYTPNIDAN